MGGFTIDIRSGSSPEDSCRPALRRPAGMRKPVIIIPGNATKTIGHATKVAWRYWTAEEIAHVHESYISKLSPGETLRCLTRECTIEVLA